MFGQSWCILSAKFGLVLPDEEIENYNFTFKQHSSGLVTVPRLKEQIAAKRLDRFRVIQVLGGKEYVDRVKAAFAGLGPMVDAPLGGAWHRRGDAGGSACCRLWPAPRIGLPATWR